MRIPLSKIHVQSNDLKRVNAVLKSGWIMQGPVVESFEKALAKTCQVKHAVAVSSGTTALHLALIVLGIKKGDEVIVPSFSWIASANAILYCGATPVFPDIDPRTYNLTAEEVQRRITRKTRAVMVVHQFGMPCDLKAIYKICSKYRIPIVEDAACAIGSKYESKPIGDCRYSKLTCLSFHPRKVLTTGEGGMVLTNDANLSDQLNMLRNHGVSRKTGKFEIIGYNYRMTDFQAALGIGQLQRLSLVIQKRRALAARYQKSLQKNKAIQVPSEPENCSSNFQSYMVRFKSASSRDLAAIHLQKAGVDTRKAIAPIHLQSCYTRICRSTKLIETEKAEKDGLILPLFEDMTFSQVDYVTEHLSKAPFQ